MALYKYHYIELDTKRSPRISLQNIVAGETGNRIWITVTNNGETVDMSEKENGEFIYRVCLKIDSDLGTRRQDSAQENSGITFIEAATGDHGKINILLSKDSFTSGMNRCRIEIFSKRAEDNDTLIISAEWTFRAAGNPTGENAGNVYPSLIELENELNQLVDEAEDAIEDCEDATEAANDATDAANNAAESANDAASDANDAASAANTAAGMLNTLLENIDAVPTQNSNNLVKSGGVYTFATELVQDLEEDHLRPSTTPLMDGDADIGGMTHQFAYEDHVHPHDTTKQNVLTFDDDPTQNSNNPVKSGGVWYALEQKQDILVLDNAPTHGSDHFVTSGTVYDAIDAAAKKNFYNVKHDTDTWTNGRYQTYTDDTGTKLAAIAADSVFSSQVELPSGKVVTVYETHRHNDYVYFKSESIIDNAYVTAEMLLSASGQSQLQFILHNSESPLTLHVSTITFDEANPLEFADEYDILSVDFVESRQTLFDAIGIRPIEVILPFGDKYYRLHTIGTFIDEGQQRTEKTVELTAAGDLLRTVPGALSNAYMSLTVTPHTPGYLLNASGYVVITES